MRVGIFVVSASVAGAGMAFAQSDWVVDPWSPSTVTPTAVQRLDDAAAAAASPQERLHMPVEWIDERNFELADPWSSAAPAPDSSRAVPAAAQKRAVKARAAESGDWAKPVPLLVDPWASAPTKALPPGDLIVDPWL